MAKKKQKITKSLSVVGLYKMVSLWAADRRIHVKETLETEEGITNGSLWIYNFLDYVRKHRND